MGNFLQGIKDRSAVRAFRRHENLIEFYRDLLENIQMNVGISLFLQSREAVAARRKHADRPVYGRMLRNIKDGKVLSDAGAGFFPGNNRIMIKAGERVDRVADGLATAIFANESSDKMRKMILSKLALPAAVLVADMILLLIFGAVVVPPFLAVVPLEKLPSSMRFSFAFTEFVVGYLWMVVPATLSAVAWFIWSLPNLSHPARKYLEKTPLYSLYRYSVSASMLITFSGLLRNNVTLHDALTLMIQSATPYERSHLDIIRRRLNQGIPLTAALETGLMPVGIIDRLRSFESAGSSKLDEAMRKMGFEHIDRTLKMVERSVRLSAALVFLMSSAVLGWMMVGNMMLTPTMQEAVRAAQMGITGPQ